MPEHCKQKTTSRWNREAADWLCANRWRCAAACVFALVLWYAASEVQACQGPDPQGWSDEPTESPNQHLQLSPNQHQLPPLPQTPAFDGFTAQANAPVRLTPLIPENQTAQTGPALAMDKAAYGRASQAHYLPSDDVRAQIGLATFATPVNDSHGSQTEVLGSGTDNAPMGSLTRILGADSELQTPGGVVNSIKVALLIATLSLAPAIILMTTCYVRVIVVLTLLRQAFGAQQLPPAQVMTALSLFITALVMTPVWTEIKTEAIDPYTRAENAISWDEAWSRGVVPVKAFMGTQIDGAGNGESIALFYKYAPDHSMHAPSTAQDVPLNVLIPAFMVSELKVAFLLGFQIYLPFLVLDLIVASVTVSSGMMMLPPTMVSFPLKLILFVLVDGWNLVVGMLLQSFGTVT